MCRNAAIWNLLSRTLPVVCYFLFLTIPLFSQPSNPRFFTVDQEVLSNKFIRCILKDSHGFMWFGTYDGLCRFDGTSVKLYEHDPGDSTSLAHNMVNAIIEDSQHNLWMGTAQGVNLYDREKDRFINVDAIPQNKNHLHHGFITALAQDNTGQIWIGTMGGGINVYNPQDFQFRYLYSNNTKDNYVASDYVTSMLIIGDKVWTGTRDGIKIYDAPTGQPESLSIIDKRALEKEVTCIIKGNGQNLWFGTSQGEVNELVFEKDHYRVKPYAHPTGSYENGRGHILSLCKDPLNNLWIAAENYGISYLDVTANKVTQFLPEEGNANSMKSNAVRSIYIDNQAMVWIGTYDKGVCFVNSRSKKFELYQRNYAKENTLAAHDVKAFAEDAEGNIWIATDSWLNKLRIRDRVLMNSVAINDTLRNKSITDMMFDSHQDLWLGTWKEGVIRVRHKTSEVTHYPVEATGIGNNKILCIYEDKRKNIWAGTSGSGLFYFDPNANKFIQLCEKGKPEYVPATSYVTSILEDSDSTLWVGTLYGLFALKREGDHRFTYTSYYQNTQSGSLSSGGIQILHEDANRNLWIGTIDKGINLWMKKTKTFKSFQKQHGLSSNTIRGILTDSKGHVWISSNAGISKFDPVTHTSKTYYKADGLNSNNFHANSCFKASSGEFLFGGNNGFNIFYPDSIKDNHTSPIMYLTDLKINNQPVKIGAEGSPLKKQIGLTNSIALSYEQRSFTIDFVAINYGSSSRNQYCYKLEGFEDAWNCTGPNNRATYTNIDPGRYVFLVKGANSDGVWADTPARLELTVYPPFWKTWWAMLTYVSVLAAIIYFLLKIKTERIKIKNQLALEKMAREKEHELTQSKMQFFTNISHELRTPLSLIMAPLEGLTSAPDVPLKIKEKLSITYRNASRMLRLVNELMDFRKLDEGKIKLTVASVDIVEIISAVAANFVEISNRRNISFSIDSQVHACTGWIDRDKIETILSNLLTNAFKFVNDNGQIKINVRVTNDTPLESNGKRNRFLEFVVSDNGIGISAKELPYIFDKFYQAKSSSIKKTSGTGIGLALVKGLAELHHGTVAAESIPHHETRFTVTVPIDLHAYNKEELCEPIPDTPETELEIVPESMHGKDEEYDSTLEKPQVLLIEDNNELRDYLANELSKHFTVTQAADGQEGLEVAFARTPDLIVSDIVMPRKSGIELCADLKSDIRTSHIPIILLTAKTTVEDQIEGIGTGADVYLPKPFSIRVLKVHIKQLIELRRKLYASFSQDVYMMPAKIAQNEIDQAFLQKAIDYIVQNITNAQLNVEMLADIFNISRSQVYRKIKGLTGNTAVEFIRTVRLKQALKLMETQKYTVAEVAYQTGFASPSYFTRSFKEQYGKAPSEYLHPKGFQEEQSL
jgi:signal transduction histidine kinase/ligand-binding sensor domain-containing protein/DNA-binding response OmpR family regulator